MRDETGGGHPCTVPAMSGSDIGVRYGQWVGVSRTTVGLRASRAESWLHPGVWEESEKVWELPLGVNRPWA